MLGFDRTINLILMLGMALAGLATIGALSAILLSLVRGDRAYFAWYVPLAAAAAGLALTGLRWLLVTVSPPAADIGSDQS